MYGSPRWRSITFSGMHRLADWCGTRRCPPGVSVPWEVVLDQDPLPGLDAPVPDPCYNPDAILALIYTSGTTGRPKGVIVTHANILANVHNLSYWVRYREGGVYLHSAPIFHIADFPAMFAAPAFGVCQATLPGFHVQSFCEAVATQHVNYTVLVPTMINLLTQSAETKKYDLSSLEAVAYGGSPMAPELIHRIRGLLPNVKLVQVYGLSETGFLTGLRDEEHSEDRLTSCGRPSPGVDVQVVDPMGKPLAAGNRGELVARGANVMRGYWDHADDTAAASRDGFFRTGDIGYQGTDGYFHILDRLKDMIVTGGENVYSGEVEAAITAHPAVRESAVLGVPDPQWGEVVAACVVLRAGMSITPEELFHHCRQALANYKVPRRIEFLETDLPKSGTGKVLKRLLREHFPLPV